MPLSYHGERKITIISCIFPKKGRFQQGQYAGADAVKLAEGQRIDAEAALDGVGRPAETLQKPVLISGPGGRRRHLRHQVTGAAGHGLAQGLGLRRLEAAVLPVDFLALGVEGHEDVGPYPLRQLRQQAPFLPLCFESRSVLTQQGVFEALTPTAADPFYDLGNWQLHLAG